MDKKKILFERNFANKKGGYKHGFFFFDFVMEVDWQSSTRRMGQNWLEAKK